MSLLYLWNGDTAMRTGRPKVKLVLSGEERSQLQSIARSRSLPAALSNRARIVLSSADGEPNNLIVIPTYSSWLNQGERFFALITD
jgi:hypothetical protein